MYEAVLGTIYERGVNKDGKLVKSLLLCGQAQRQLGTETTESTASTRQKCLEEAICGLVCPYIRTKSEHIAAVHVQLGPLFSRGAHQMR